MNAKAAAQEQGNIVPLGEISSNEIALKPEDRKSYGDLTKLAIAVSQTEMIPKDYQGEPQKTAVAMMYAQEAGVNPLTGLSFIAVINGKPGWYAEGIPGVAKMKGLITGYKEWFTGKPYEDDYTAHCKVFTPSGMEYENHFSVADAKLANLWERNVWKPYPRRMMQWRARSWAVRDAAPEAFMGPTAEELRDAFFANIGPDNAKLIPGDPKSTLDAFVREHGGGDQGEDSEKPEQHDDDGVIIDAEAKGMTEASPDDQPPDVKPPKKQQAERPKVWLSRDQPAYTVDAGKLGTVLLTAIDKAMDPKQVEELMAYNSGVISAVLDTKAQDVVNDAGVAKLQSFKP